MGSNIVTKVRHVHIELIGCQIDELVWNFIYESWRINVGVL